jgi:hypothetical protein
MSDAAPLPSREELARIAHNVFHDAGIFAATSVLSSLSERLADAILAELARRAPSLAPADTDWCAGCSAYIGRDEACHLSHQSGRCSIKEKNNAKA